MTTTARRFAAWLLVCWTAACGTYESNVWPLKFGMTPAQVSAALGLPLTRYSGSPGSEVYLAGGPINLPPDRFPGVSTIVLQFRHGHLTGWKKEWSLDKPWIIY
jgi:hypothetical protein